MAKRAKADRLSADLRFRGRPIDKRRLAALAKRSKLTLSALVRKLIADAAAEAGIA